MDVIVVPTCDEADSITRLLGELRSAVPGHSTLGNAYRHGFRWAHERGYERVVQMDADGSHQPELVPALLDALAEADIAVGSRYVAGGATVDWPLHRQLVSRLGNLYVCAMLDLPVRDTTSRFRACRSAALAALATAGGEANGYCFQIESTWRAAAAKLTIKEVPIVFSDRTLGRSKIGPGIVLEAMWRVLSWRLRRADVLSAPAQPPIAVQH